MPDTFKFPNGGYEVTIVRKKDIIDCLDANVIDKEVVLEVISQCEFDASNFIRDGKWTGIPFFGNIRTSKHYQKVSSPEIQKLIQEAKETLDTNRYYIFRKELNTEICNEIKQDKFYRYITASFVNRNKRFYNEKVKLLGEAGARFLCYTLTNMSYTTPKDLL